jgi:zinc/manganese transport system permease protein
MNLTALDPALLGPPFVAGLLILATHVPLGRQVLARGIVFLDLAVAQIAGLGVIAAHFAGIESGWQVQVFAVMAAVAGALLLHWAERRWPETQEALIGTVFVVAASAGLLMLAHDPHGVESLHDLLAGQILWVSNTQLMIAAGVTALLGLLLLAGVAHVGFGFYLVFACAVTLTVQLAGIYLVFASLIIPALAVRQWKGRSGLVAGWGIGASGYFTGLSLSALLDLPSGAMIVCTLSVIALFFSFLGGKFKPA